MIGITAEELPPPIGEVVKELHSPIGVVDEELLPPIGVVAKKLSSPMEVVDEKLPYQGAFTERAATANLNITTTTMQKMDHMV